MGLEYSYRGGTVTVDVNCDDGVVRGLKRYLQLVCKWGQWIINSWPQIVGGSEVISKIQTELAGYLCAKIRGFTDSHFASG
jgi:hypothetical protein